VALYIHSPIRLHDVVHDAVLSTGTTFRCKLNCWITCNVITYDKHNDIRNGLPEFPVTLNNMQNSDTFIKKNNK
jgi:hypothetical protein